jgi:hypothetical protein
MGRRGASFSKREIQHLLDDVEEILPSGQTECDIVEARHNAAYPEAQRTRETIKRKFQSLYLTRIPTGDPHCPPFV